MINRKMTIKDFPIGFYDDLHPDFSINFQMNRFYNWSNDHDMLNEMRKVSPSIHSYAEYIDTFLGLSKKALSDGHQLKAAYYLRGAEFYMPTSDPKKHTSRKQFISLMQEYFDIKQDQQHKIPYESGFLSAYRLVPDHPRGRIVLFGGFDSYVEELFLMAIIMKDAGYEVICFDGPGQGATLEDNSIPMTHEWEKPVKSVLDFFNLDNVTLIGISLGGYLVVRAAAFESRIQRVIADDICADFYKVLLRQIPDNFRDKFHNLMVSERSGEVNSIFEEFMGKSLMLEWGINQGMHVTGSQTPYEFMRKLMSYNTTEISPLLSQDVLLMAAQNDHYIPLNQFFEQSQTLVNVRSLTTRMFTKKEQAHNHCHIGNIGLSIDVMLNWIQQMESKES